MRRFNDRAIAAFEDGDLPRARELFDQVIQCEPTSQRYYYRGVIHDILGDQDKALADLLNATKIDPSNSHALYSLAIIFQQTGKLEESHKAIQMAYHVDPYDFRILNYYAQVLLTAPNPSIRNPPMALKLAAKACQLTNNMDELCIATLQDAKAVLAQSSAPDATAAPLEQPLPTLPTSQNSLSTTQPDASALASGQTNQHQDHSVGDESPAESPDVPEPTDPTQEIIDHFETHLGRKSNELSLQNIVKPSVAIAVQTICAAQGSSQSTFLFTTGLSSIAMNALPGQAHLRFAELYMLIPSDWQPPQEINDHIWPWHLLQKLGHQPHSTGKALRGDADVFTFDASPSPLSNVTDFAGVLLLPNLKHFIDPLVTRRGNEIVFVNVTPLYADEIELARSAGIGELLQRIQAAKMRPALTPGRPSLAQ